MQSKKEGNNHESWWVQLETLLRYHTDEAEYFKEDGYSDVPFGNVSEDRPFGLPTDFWEEITKSRSLDCGRLFKSERGVELEFLNAVFHENFLHFTFRQSRKDANLSKGLACHT